MGSVDGCCGVITRVTAGARCYLVQFSATITTSAIYQELIRFEHLNVLVFFSLSFFFFLSFSPRAQMGSES